MLLAEWLTEQAIGLAIEVPRNTGPGLLEAAYEQCLCVELRRAPSLPLPPPCPPEGAASCLQSRGWCFSVKLRANSVHSVST